MNLSRRLAGAMGVVGIWMVAACGTMTETIPETKQTNWYFDRDDVRRESAHIAIGFTREDVVNELGLPPDKRTLTSDPTVEVYRYSRKVIGQMRVKSAPSGAGTVVVANRQQFEDRIRVYFRGDKVVSVLFERIAVEDLGNAHRG